MTFGHAHVFGVADACVHASFVLLSLWLARRRLWLLIALIAAVPLLVYTITATGTRAALFLPPATMLAIFWFYRGRVNFAAIIGGSVAAVAIGYIIAGILTPDLLARFSPDLVREGLNVRIYMIRETWTGFLQAPFLGNGTGDTNFQFGKPHNHVLEVANELGLMGLVPYLLLLGFGLRAGFRLCSKRLDGTQVKEVAVPIFACFLYQILLSFKAGSYAAVYLEYFFLVLVLVIERLYLRERFAAEEPTLPVAFPEAPALAYRPTLAPMSQTQPSR